MTIRKKTVSDPLFSLTAISQIFPTTVRLLRKFFDQELVPIAIRYLSCCYFFIVLVLVGKTYTSRLAQTTNFHV